MSNSLEFVICRGYPGHKCECEYAKWAHPYCRKCWKSYYKRTNYIEKREEVEKYCTH
jgi:hypothetical protein